METKTMNVVLAARTLCVLAVLVFTNVAFAYPTGTLPPEPVPTVNGTSEFDFGSSFQNLVSPFNDFVQALQGNGLPTSFSNPAPQPASSGPLPPSKSLFRVFDDWFAGFTGIRLSAIFTVLFSLLSWVLGLAKRIVDWLLWLVR